MDSPKFKNNKIINVTVKRLKCGYYEASIIYETIECSLAKTGKNVGIDLGVRKLITTSENDFVKISNNEVLIYDTCYR